MCLSRADTAAEAACRQPPYAAPYCRPSPAARPHTPKHQHFTQNIQQEGTQNARRKRAGAAESNCAKKGTYWSVGFETPLPAVMAADPHTEDLNALVQQLQDENTELTDALAQKKVCGKCVDTWGCMGGGGEGRCRPQFRTGFCCRWMWELSGSLEWIGECHRVGLGVAVMMVVVLGLCVPCGGQNRRRKILLAPSVAVVLGFCLRFFGVLFRFVSVTCTQHTTHFTHSYAHMCSVFSSSFRHRCVVCPCPPPPLAG